MLPRVATAVAAGLVPVVLAFHGGGYFPSEWGLELGFFAVAAIVALLLVPVLVVARPEIAVVCGLLALAGWSLASILWSTGADGPVLAAERTLVYAAAVAAVLLGLSGERMPWLLGGLLGGAAAVCLYALGTRVLAGSIGDASDAVTGTRLAAPIGYANALGALAAFGAVLALGFALHERVEIRLAAGALLVPLLVTLYFTLSRGSVVALVAGVLAVLAVERSENALGALLVVGAAPAAAVALAVRSPLLDGGLSLHDARASGHRLALELAGLVVAGGAAGAVAVPVARRILPVAWLAIATAAAVAAAALVLAGPLHLVHRVRDAYRTVPPATSGAPTRRLFSGSSSGRSEYWDVAARMIRREPLLGEGAGSYERWWLQERPVANDARNAHDLYLETFAELGPVGLALLLVVLAPPLLVRRDGEPATTAAFAGYLTWLAHMVFDWDWQIPAVSLLGLGCGCALLLQARGTAVPVRPTLHVRLLGVVALLPVLAVALVVHAGNRAVDGAEAALAAGRPAAAAADARRARRWLPWAGEPWRLLGESELARHRDAAARASLRRSIAKNRADWVAWYDLATVTGGAARRRALVEARRLNPLAPELTGSG